jgi:hypothetical protein
MRLSVSEARSGVAVAKIAPMATKSERMLFVFIFVVFFLSIVAAIASNIRVTLSDAPGLRYGV